MYAIGYDIGSSSVKAAIVHLDRREVIAVIQHPPSEMPISAPQPGWAEQDPSMWWNSLCLATKQLLEMTGIDPTHIESIGLAYQMHGLVLIDKDHRPLRPAIIWCDSRAVEIGESAFDRIGREFCLQHMLNSPGNFTASKLRWVMENEPGVYAQVKYLMLPGDYIGMKLTGHACTTITGLSEAVLWDFKEHTVAGKVLEHFNIERSIIPGITGSFDLQGVLSHEAARETGLSAGTLLTYRAGDQPNNALTLGVFEPNEVAATGGTSGVIYGVVDALSADPLSRVNGFAHVNHTAGDPRIGQLLCINGAGIQHAWMKKQVADSPTSYVEMEQMMGDVPVGCDGLRIIPFGNGSERILRNANTGAQINNLHFNKHSRAHLIRAGVEGVAFSFAHGFSILRELGLSPTVIKVGNDNLFRSRIFGETVATLLQCDIQVQKTTGAVGAALASTCYSSGDPISSTITGGAVEHVYSAGSDGEQYQEAFAAWRADLEILESKGAGY